MDHQDTLSSYEKSLNERDLGKILDMIHEDAVFIFSEGTFKGRDEIKSAITKTFDLIQDEVYEIKDVEWILEKTDVAVCVYKFFWQGMINDQKASGGGRGTTVLHRILENEWKVIHEHLGPLPK